MSKHSTWRNTNDFMEDIWAFSEMEGIGSQDVREPPPATILEYQARMRANNSSSVYDDPEIDRDVTYIISGRGRGGISTILRPGVSQASEALVTEEVQRKIREVSGLGYSNELIEQGVKAMSVAGDKTANDARRTPQTSSPMRRTSGLSSPMENSKSSTCSSVNSSPQRKSEGETSHPPPLSVMRKKAQRQRLKDKEKTPEEQSKIEEEVVEKLPWNNGAKSYVNGNGGSWQTASSESSSDECSWRRRDGTASNRFFKQQGNGFTLNTSDFPALK